MAKLLFLPLLVGLVLMAGCMPPAPVSLEEPMVRIFHFPGKVKDDLFILANDWMVTNFVSSESVVEYSDKEAGRLLGKYVLNDNVVTIDYGTVGEVVKAKIDISVKDSAAKIEIVSLSPWRYDSSGLTIYDYSVDDARNDITNLISSFEEHLRNSSDDW